MSSDLIFNFDRIEKKYLLNDSQLALMQKAIEPYFQESEFGQSRIVSVYYDNENYELIQKSIEKPKYKEKLRIRAYSPSFEENQPVFAEIKKKYNGIVYKRRVCGSYTEIKKMLDSPGGRYKMPNSDLQIQGELQWMMQRYHLQPKIWISCMRSPYQAKDGSDLRITFDSDLQYQITQPDLCYPGSGYEIIPQNQHIMEIKTAGGLPLWLCKVLSSNEIYPHSFSKVGTAFENKIFQSILQE